MTSAIVVGPGNTKNAKKSIYVVVNVPTIEVEISFVPLKLPDLNIFQKGVAFFLLAGVSRIDAIAHVMGVTDDEFVGLILSELVMNGYARQTQNVEFEPTTKLRKEFSDPVKFQPSRNNQMIIFVPSGDAAVKVGGPLGMPVQVTEVHQNGNTFRVSVGTEGKPLEVDCIVSNELMKISYMVERAKAKEWIIPPSGRKSALDLANESSTKVEILATKHRAFVLQCRLKDSVKFVSRSLKPDVLRQSLHVSFAGDDAPSQRLGSWLSLIASNDQEFLDQMEFAVRELLKKREENRASKGGNPSAHKHEYSDEPPDEQMDEQTDVAETTHTRGATKVRDKVEPLAWLLETLNSRLGVIGTAQLEALLVHDLSIGQQIAERLVGLGSKNRKPAIPPLQLEGLAAGQFHDELDVREVLGVWLLMEHDEVLRDLIDHTPGFIGEVCEIFVAPHTHLKKDMREAFQHLLSVNTKEVNHG